MLRLVRLVLAACIAAGPAFADVPERRLALTRDVDFPGADLRQIFDTVLSECQEACLLDARCRAMTLLF